MNKTCKRILATLMALAAMLALAACGSTSAPETTAAPAATNAPATATPAATTAPTPEPTPEPTPAEPKEIRSSLYSFPGDLEPTTNYYGWGVSRIGVGEALMRFDENMDTVPLVAESVENIDDTTWIFHIREGVTFHNGNPVDAEAVKNSIERAMELNTRAKSIAKIASMHADGLDLTIETTEPYGAFLGYMAEPVFTIVDTSVDTSNFANQPICTGPFMVESMIPSTEIVVVKNENYWGGEPNVDKITFLNLADSNAITMALQAGEINIGQEVSGTDLYLFDGNSDYVVSTRPGTRTIYCCLNVASQFLSDMTVRKAITSAVDLDLYASTYVGGATGVGPFSPVLKFGYDELNGYTFDPEKAAALLDEAGYIDTNGDGIREKGGAPISIQIAVIDKTNQSIHKSVAEAMQAQLKNIGINSELTVSTELTYDDLRANYDIVFKGVNAGSTNDPQNFLQLYFTTDCSYSYGNYSNPELDALIGTLDTEFDLARRTQIGVEASQMILDDCAFLFIGYPDYNIVTSSNISGLKHYPLNIYLVDKDIDIN